MMEKWIVNFNKFKEDVDENDLIQYWNHVTKEDLDNYDSFLKHLNKRWNKFKRKLVNQLSKQICDSAMNNRNWSYLRPSNNKPLKF